MSKFTRVGTKLNKEEMIEFNKDLEHNRLTQYEYLKKLIYIRLDPFPYIKNRITKYEGNYQNTTYGEITCPCINCRRPRREQVFNRGIDSFRRFLKKGAEYPRVKTTEPTKDFTYVRTKLNEQELIDFNKILKKDGFTQYEFFKKMMFTNRNGWNEFQGLRHWMPRDTCGGWNRCSCWPPCAPNCEGQKYWFGDYTDENQFWAPLKLGTHKIRY